MTRYHIKVNGTRRYFDFVPDVDKIKAGDPQPYQVKASSVVPFYVAGLDTAKWMLRTVYKAGPS